MGVPRPAAPFAAGSDPGSGAARACPDRTRNRLRSPGSRPLVNGPLGGRSLSMRLIAQPPVRVRNLLAAGAEGNISRLRRNDQRRVSVVRGGQRPTTSERRGISGGRGAWAAPLPLPPKPLAERPSPGNYTSMDYVWLHTEIADPIERLHQTSA